jgi:hypothetical protein
MVIFVNLPKHAALPTVKIFSKCVFKLWIFIRLAVPWRQPVFRTIVCSQLNPSAEL